MRRLLLEATLNTRDLGGYPTADGGMTRYGVFYRSDLAAALSPGDRQRLERADIRAVIDLRSDKEVADLPSAFGDCPGIAYRHIPMAGGGRLPVDEADVVASYMEMALGREAVRAILRCLADTEGAVLFHCAAGKDRTGVVAALLLLTAEVAPADILADYQISESYLLPLIRKLTAERGLPLHVVTPRPAFMEGFLEAFYTRFGSMDAYFETIGLEADTVGRLRDKIISPAEQAINI